MRDCSFMPAGVRYRSPLLGIQAGATPCCPARRPCFGHRQGQLRSLSAKKK
nr:MAG TPA: hypothetical protein [Bacteriophage sp.]